MRTFKPKPSDYIDEVLEGKTRRLLKTPVYDSFNTSLLGLGDIKKPAVTTDAIAAVFDLQGFTNFCKQIEPHLTVPLFLNLFLSWLLSQIKEEMTYKKLGAGAHLFGALPFFVKFMGDGLLVLWDASPMSEISRRNVLVAADAICVNYKDKFLPTIAKRVVDAPPVLRCGLARGAVFSVGDGDDFVGSCINMAARLEKIPGVTFAFNLRGFDLEDPPDVEFLGGIVVQKIAIRGIGDNELVAIRRDEFKGMSPEDKKQFRDPVSPS